jgi:methionine-rich copper-binding protein CopC
MRRLALVIGALLVSVCAAVAWAPVASAHSSLVSSDPSNGASLATGPATVTLTFNEPIQESYATLKVIGPDKHYWEDGEPTVTGRSVSVPVRELGPAGEYLINYRITSADGHPVEGQLTFELTTAGSGTPGAAVDAGSSSSSSGIPVWPFIVGGVVVFAGGLAFALRPQRKK